MQTVPHSPDKLQCVNTVKCRKIVFQLCQGFGELTASAFVVVIAEMVKPNRGLYQALIEKPMTSRGFHPQFLPRVMRLEEIPAVEFPNTPFKEPFHLACKLRKSTGNCKIRLSLQDKICAASTRMEEHSLVSSVEKTRQLEDTMDTTLLQYLKESIMQQRENLVEWLNGTPADVKQLRVGSSGEQAVHDRLRLLSAALQKAEEKTLGLCEVCHDYVETSRLEMDYTACVCIEHLTGKERSMLENDLELSQKVQRALLPQGIPKIHGLEVAAFSRPARIVGGDYFDFVRMKDGSHAIVIADVMGKGMPASMLMASLQASLRIIAPESAEPADVVSRLNHLFNHNIRLTKFVTLFLARYDENTRVLTYCNAGHNPPLVHRTDGSVEALLPTGAAIGLIEQTDFSQGRITLHPGDRVLMYTDGVVEAMDNDERLFGQERLEKLLEQNPGSSAHNVILSLKEQLQKFSGVTTPEDDTTIIAVNVIESLHY